MKFTLAVVAFFVSAALAAPLKSAARDLNEAVETMTDPSGAIVPFDTAGVTTNAA